MRWILVAGGGTGGHVFPGLAVARALGRLADVDVVFAGSPRGLEARVVPEHGYALELFDVEPMKGGGPGRAIRGALVAAKATRKARAIVRRLAPAAVLSVGGYAAGPAALACVSQRVPLAILEPNSTLGLANKLLAPFAKRAYVAWPKTGSHFGADKARLYGVPLRPGFEPRAYAPSAGPRRLLVLGGSQGAQALNEALPRAVALAQARSAPFTVVHQAGRDREASVRAAYAERGVRDVEVVPFLDDVAARMTAADLIVARSGAVTVAEISAIGRAAVLVPFPHAADDHQAKNALSLADVGGAVCVRQEAADEARLADEIAALLGDDARRTRMADAAREHGRPHAAEDVARDLLALARISVKKSAPPPPTNGATNGGSSRFRVAATAKKEVS
ncbi:MAG: undecaprenyldiphospho-muramoylpentapeptide beta-N-acetylglucosaminyltransferase [Labilithrix sp.]|nr:undecaprenyldiphospho-muramoylpentapeptide beta-N-acetylglucosaminyltransferase [Labilithrix sp.]